MRNEFDVIVVNYERSAERFSPEESYDRAVCICKWSGRLRLTEENGVWWSVVECGGVWWSVVECGGVWWSVVECGGVWWSVAECGAVWWSEGECG